MLNKKYRNTLVVFLVLVSLFFSVCSYRKAGPVTIENIITNLESNGYTVQITEPSKTDMELSSYFPMLSSMKFLYINDSSVVNIVIYSFDSVEIAQQQAKTIDKEGYMIGNSYLEWVLPQIFFLKDNLIIRFTKGSSYIKSFTGLLGKPITE